MATTYEPRSAWTSTSRGGARQDGDSLRGLVVHYTGVSRTYAGLSRAGVARVLRGIRRYHVGTKGWADIGYSVAIDHDGRVWDLRGITRVPAAHASASHPLENWHRSAVLLLLGVGEQPSETMIEAFRDFRTRRWLEEWPGADDLLGHRQVPGASTACPGDPAAALVTDGTLTGQPDGTGGTGDGAYTVQAGDTLWDIAARHDTTVDELVRLNSIADPGLIRPGQQLHLPDGTGGDVRPAPGPQVEFPLPDGHYFGPQQWGDRSVSGHYGRWFRGHRDRYWLRRWVRQLRKRGWDARTGGDYLSAYGNDGLYGDEYEQLIKAFQADQDLTVDGLLGEDTWTAAYENPVL